MSRNRMTSVSLCLVLVLLALPARAGAQETTDDRWTPELSMRYFGVGGTTISLTAGTSPTRFASH